MTEPTEPHDCHYGPAVLTVAYELEGLLHLVHAERCCAEMIPDADVIPPGATITEVHLMDSNGETIITPDRTVTIAYESALAS